MKRFSCVFIMLLALSSAPAYSDQLSVSIGINLFEYPELAVVPGYPVYYAPRLDANYFFYDGDYWVYQDDNWYRSPWYDGPWRFVDPYDVPVFILRIPIRYYRRPPVFFFSWYSEAAPHWGEHWGHDWDEHRSGWDRWDRRIHVKPAPLPLYQRRYTGDRYPRQFEQQHELQQRHYHYQPRDPYVQRQYDQRIQTAPVPQGGIFTPQQDRQRSAPRQQDSGIGPGVSPPPRNIIMDQRGDRRDSRMQDTQRRDERQQDRGDTYKGDMRDQRRGQDQDRGRDR